MRKILASLAFALLLGACSTLNPATTVSTVKAQQTLDLVQAVHKAVVRGEVVYLTQPGCGVAGAPPPPLCASYAVGLQMKRLDDKATTAITTAQDAINLLGNNPAAIEAALAAARLAVNEFQTFAASYGVKA